MAYSQRFGVLLKEHLAGKDYREVARRLGSHYTTLYNYARGEAPGEEETVRRLAEVLELTGQAGRELLAAAGFADDPSELASRLVDVVRERQRPTYETVREEAVVEAFRGFDPAHQEALWEVVEALRREKRGVADG